MKELMLMLSICEDEQSEIIQVAQGKYEFTGRIIKDFLKIVENGKGNSRD